MRLGHYRNEDEPEVWGKLRGDIDLYANEAIGLVGLFGCTYEYLFSNKLSVMNGKPLAYHRWREHNIRIKYECEASDLGYKILAELREKPYMYGFMKMAVRLNEDEIKTMTKMMSVLSKNRRTV